MAAQQGAPSGVTMTSHAETDRPQDPAGSAFGDRELAVCTRGLTKTYRTKRGLHTAVGSLDLDVPAGGVHGFLGPNGSGKTTTIRMLLGLIRPASGTMHLFGTPVPNRLPEVINRVGAIVEAPKFFPHFPATTSLNLLADAIGTPRARVGEVLDEVGLASRGGDKFSTYSLGMKQRLAIAATLLKSPDLLIFDEPTNGLDPAGIQEIRGTMRELGRQGRTVLVSSHILSEVEQVADTVSIIGRGRMLAQGRVDDLIVAKTSGTAAVEVTVADTDAARTEQVLRGAGWTVAGGSDTGTFTVSGADLTTPSLITERLAAQRIYLERLVPQRRGLEAVFLELTGSPPDAGATAQPMGTQWTDGSHNPTAGA